MYFSTTDGSFYTEWEVDASITEPTEIYMHKDIWYSNGYKMVASDANGATDKVTWHIPEDTGLHYTQVIYDADYLQSVDGQKVKVLLTKAIPSDEMTGIVQEDGTIVDWSIEDAGTTDKCSFNFQWADGVDSKIEIALLDNTGKQFQTFKASTETPAVFDCSSLAGAQAQLTRSKMFGHDVLTTVPLAALNGHNVTVNVRPNPSEIFTQ